MIRAQETCLKALSSYVLSVSALMAFLHVGNLLLCVHPVLPSHPIYVCLAAMRNGRTFAYLSDSVGLECCMQGRGEGG